MRGIVPLAAICVCLASLLGCRFAGLRDPVPETLATSRRLSQDGRESLDQGDNAKAEQVLAQAVKICPTDSDAHGYYAESLWRKGAQAEAIAELQEAIKLNPENPDRHVRAAQMYLERGNLFSSRQASDAAIATKAF